MEETKQKINIIKLTPEEAEELSSQMTENFDSGKIVTVFQKCSEIITQYNVSPTELTHLVMSLFDLRQQILMENFTALKPMLEKPSDDTEQ